MCDSNNTAWEVLTFLLYSFNEDGSYTVPYRIHLSDSIIPRPPRYVFIRNMFYSTYYVNGREIQTLDRVTSFRAKTDNLWSLTMVAIPKAPLVYKMNKIGY